MTAKDFSKIEDILRLHLQPKQATEIMKDIRSQYNYRAEGSRPGYKGSVVIKPLATEIPITRWFSKE